MAGITNIQQLLKEMEPFLDDTEYIFTTLNYFSLNEEIISLNPIATFIESEGITLVINRFTAEKHKIPFDVTFKKITLQIHSSLEAVGLTAAVSKVLTENNISANVIAANYHDHIFVPKHKAELSLKVLQALTQ